MATFVSSLHDTIKASCEPHLPRPVFSHRREFPVPIDAVPWSGVSGAEGIGNPTARAACVGRTLPALGGAWQAPHGSRRGRTGTGGDEVAVSEGASGRGGRFSAAWVKGAARQRGPHRQRGSEGAVTRAWTPASANAPRAVAQDQAPSGRSESEPPIALTASGSRRKPAVIRSASNQRPKGSSFSGRSLR